MPNAYQSTHWTGPQIDQIYPVGSIYMSVNSTSPADLFGGEWEEINNTFLVAQGTSYTAGTTGGSITSGEPSNNISGETAITIAQMPSHNHGKATLTGYANFRDIAMSDNNLLMGTSGIFSVTRPSWSGNHAAAATANKSPYYYNRLNIDAGHTHTSQGSGQGHTHTLSSHTHEVTPPYLAVYMWKRVA